MPDHQSNKTCRRWDSFRYLKLFVEDQDISFVSLCVSLCIRLGRVLIIVYAVGELLHMVLIIVYDLWWF